MQKILVVDDENVMLLLATKILSKHYEVIPATSGEEAVRLFDLCKPDLVLSDLLMPGMDGYELKRILQEKSPDPVPIMFMTADDNDESESYSLEVGAADYIRKPLKMDVLLKRVEKILEHSKKTRELKQAVDIDGMTGLLNKSAARRELADVCRNARGALMMIDLDSFKLVNDIYGHEAGDKILVKFAELLGNITCEADVLGRMGGDEFIAFCRNVTEESMIANRTKYLNEKILAAAKSFLGDEMKIPLGVSVGGVFVPESGDDFDELYKKADKSLYDVKQKGKHGYAVYRESVETSAPLGENFSDVDKILGERNPARGAYFVAPDMFKVVYRLAVRIAGSYGKNILFARLTLKNADESDVDDFRELLAKTLRPGDCFTKYSANQFFALLPETTAEDAEKKILDGVKTFKNPSVREFDFDATELLTKK